MHWRTTYFKALELTHRVFWLYPKHILEQPLQANPETIQNDPYFTSAYVHLGPFRLVEWGLGENMVFQRHDNYFMGRPKVERMVIHVIGDQNAMLAALKSGAVDIVPNSTLPNDLYVDLAEEWSRTGDGVIARAPENWKYIWFQLDPRWARPVEVGQDVRFRRGFLFGLDRLAIRELIYPNMPQADTDSFLFSGDPRSSVIGQPYAAYHYDPARAIQQWTEAGWVRGADGRFVNTAGQPIQVEIRATDQNVRQVPALAAGWRSLGVAVAENITPPSRQRDEEYKATFPSMESRGRGVGEDVFTSFDGRGQALPDNRWFGANNSHYANPELDRLIDVMRSTVDSTERTQRLKEAGDILVRDMPAIPVYFGIVSMSIRRSVQGPLAEDFTHMHDSSGGPASRNAHLWQRV
jgi:peptide/nickel transport system substrate-binding protein